MLVFFALHWRSVYTLTKRDESSNCALDLVVIHFLPLGSASLYWRIRIIGAPSLASLLRLYIF